MTTTGPQIECRIIRGRPRITQIDRSFIHQTNHPPQVLSGGVGPPKLLYLLYCPFILSFQHLSPERDGLRIAFVQSSHFKFHERYGNGFHYNEFAFNEKCVM